MTPLGTNRHPSRLACLCIGAALTLVGLLPHSGQARPLPPDSSDAATPDRPIRPAGLRYTPGISYVTPRSIERWGTGPVRPSAEYTRQLALSAAKNRNKGGGKNRRSGAGPSCAPTVLYSRNHDGDGCARPHIRRRHFDGSRCNARRIHHAHYDGKGCNAKPMVHMNYDVNGCRVRCVKHYTWDHVSCTQPVVHHTSLDDQRTQCNPNDAVVMTPTEKLGLRFARLFTDDQIHCALTGMTTPVAIGDIVETQEYGRAVVIDYVIGERVDQYIEWKGTDVGDKGRVRTRKTKAIAQLVVQGTQAERRSIVGRNLTFSTVELKTNYVTATLSPEETKEILIRRLLDRGERDKVVLVYPEERKNLEVWAARFPPRQIRERDPAEWKREPTGRYIRSEPPKPPAPRPRRRRAG